METMAAWFWLGVRLEWTRVLHFEPNGRFFASQTFKMPVLWVETTRLLLENELDLTWFTRPFLLVRGQG